jgi:hypothetical protein
MSAMNKVSAAIAAVTFSAALIAVAPAAAAAHHSHRIVADLKPGCLALEGHGRGRAVTVARCRARRRQAWSYREPLIVSASGLCLTATLYSNVVTERCGRRGQRWDRVAPQPGQPRVLWLESQRWPGTCLVIESSRPGPVILGPCGGPLGAHGGTERWLFAARRH